MNVALVIMEVRWGVAYIKLAVSMSKIVVLWYDSYVAIENFIWRCLCEIIARNRFLQGI